MKFSAKKYNSLSSDVAAMLSKHEASSTNAAIEQTKRDTRTVRSVAKEMENHRLGILEEKKQTAIIEYRAEREIADGMESEQEMTAAMARMEQDIENPVTILSTLRTATGNAASMVN